MHSEYRKEQHYAVSKYGMLVHIKDAHKSNDDFYCPFCRCRMIKKCGKKREWHFAHDYRFANEEQKKSWIRLLVLCRDVLETCIDLLGFEAPERM